VTSGEASKTYEVWSEPIGKWLRITSFRAGADDRFATVFRDVTMHKETERALEVLVDERTTELTASLEELAEANRVKDDFLASMSHELRTPLNSIIGFSGILSQGLAGPLNEEQQKQIAIIRESGERLLGLVNDVLDLSRIESGRVEVLVEEFDLVSLVANMVETVGPMAEQKHLELSVSSIDPLIPMWTDREKVGQIVLNLLSNAIKYTDEGSVIVEVEPSRDGLTASVTVTDTGCGIQPEDIGGLFDRFATVRGLVRRVEDGAGLGLSISRRLATLLGGTLAVESMLGEGSTFTFRLPVRHPDARL
jgi:signal transduction histidine kinase